MKIDINSSELAKIVGGEILTPAIQIKIHSVTISTLGDATKFGDLITKRNAHAGSSNSTRGIMGGGEAPSRVNTITYITLATLGDGIDFGDLTTVRNDQDAVSSSTRAFFTAGHNGSAITNLIDFVTISTTGNASDFGDLTQARSQPSSCSDVHGGLG